MSSFLPLGVAETIQTASIKRHPSPSHDLNPSTAASEKEPVKLSSSQLSHALASEPSLDKYAYDDEDGIDALEEEDIPYSVLKPTPRRQSFGPLPDLRFEQSYLASIAGADTRWRVLYITVRDQVFLPFVQGMVWSLALHGWRFWNRNAQLSGSSVGAKVRRWWYRTNNWKMPESITKAAGNEKLAKDVGDYYQNQNSSD